MFVFVGSNFNAYFGAESAFCKKFSAVQPFENNWVSFCQISDIFSVNFIYR